MTNRFLKWALATELGTAFAFLTKALDDASLNMGQQTK